MSGDDVGLIGFADSSDAASSANAAMQAGAWDEAVQHWARRRAEAPTDSAAYVRAALCLRRLAREFKGRVHGYLIRLHAGAAEGMHTQRWLFTVL